MADAYDIASRPFTLTCPECGGALYPADVAAVSSYTCHIGHVLTWPAMAEAQLARLEFALGAALALVKERAELYRQLAESGEIDARIAEAVIAETTERAERLKELLTATWRTVSPGPVVQRLSDGR
jgi:two-component system chemotaxis response regulator CheB